ncbi:MAG: hypothetical protein NTU79_15500 [Planctomycetota bacterium]|nr:hypothetical protein [Planctomycetota bacterium]
MLRTSVSDPNNNGVVLENNVTIQGQTLANSLVTVSRTVVLNCSEVPCTSETVEDNRSTLADAQGRFTFDLPVAEGLQTVRSQYFHGRERDEAEVKGYTAAIPELEATVARKGKVTELTIQTLHASVMGSGKKRVKPTPYSEGQNVIRDSANRAIVYLPPESKVVPTLPTLPKKPPR